MGKAMMKEWFMSPLVSIDEIERRQRSVGFFVNPTNASTVSELEKQLKKVPNISQLLERLNKQSQVSDWHSIVKVLVF
jgi:DNA mismatch repair ATPase MutS